jgi:hypothetical protein
VEATRVCAWGCGPDQAAADAALAAFYRERDIQRAAAKERDPAAPLQ